jgi:hypothetical protein
LICKKYYWKEYKGYSNPYTKREVQTQHHSRETTHLLWRVAEFHHIICSKVGQKYNTTYQTIGHGASTTNLKDLPAITMTLLTTKISLLLPIPNKTSIGSLHCITCHSKTAPPKQGTFTLLNLDTLSYHANQRPRQNIALILFHQLLQMIVCCPYSEIWSFINCKNPFILYTIG